MRHHWPRVLARVACSWLVLLLFFEYVAIEIVAPLRRGSPLFTFVVLNSPRPLMLFWIDVMQFLPGSVLGCVLVGWVAGRIGRGQRGAVLMALLATLFLWPAFMAAWLWVVPNPAHWGPAPPQGLTLAYVFFYYGGGAFGPQWWWTWWYVLMPLLIATGAYLPRAPRGRLA